MDTSTFYPGKYLRSIEIVGRQLKLEIDRVEPEEMEGSGEIKPVLYFKDKTKGVVLNKTNLGVLQQKWGTDSDAWIGATIILSTTKVRNPNGGGMVDGFMILIPAAARPAIKPKAAPAPAPQEVENPAADMDDEIPF